MIRRFRRPSLDAPPTVFGASCWVRHATVRSLLSRVSQYEAAHSAVAVKEALDAPLIIASRDLESDADWTVVKSASEAIGLEATRCINTGDVTIQKPKPPPPRASLETSAEAPPLTSSEKYWIHFQLKQVREGKSPQLQIPLARLDATMQHFVETTCVELGLLCSVTPDEVHMVARPSRMRSVDHAKAKVSAVLRGESPQCELSLAQYDASAIAAAVATAAADATVEVTRTPRSVRFTKRRAAAASKAAALTPHDAVALVRGIAANGDQRVFSNKLAAETLAAIRRESDALGLEADTLSAGLRVRKKES